MTPELPRIGNPFRSDVEIIPRRIVVNWKQGPTFSKIAPDFPLMKESEQS